MASIQKNRRGKYEARYKDAKGRHRSKTFSRKKAAREWIIDNEIEQKKFDPDGAKTRFGTIGDEWLSNRLNISAGSLARDNSFYLNHIAPAFAEREVGSLDTREIQEWLKSLTIKRRLAPRTVRECVRILSAILKTAVKQGYISFNPAEDVVLPRVERKEQMFLTEEQLFILSEEINAHFKAMIVLTGFMGLRWGEVIAIRRKDVYFLKRELNVWGSIEEVGGRFRYSASMKSKRSRRTLKIPPLVVDELSRHFASLPKGQEFIFMTPKGTHPRRSNFRRQYWLPATARAGLDGLRFHDLRHTAAALAFDANVGINEVSRMLGHASIGITDGFYNHLTDTRRDFVADAIQKNSKIFTTDFTTRGQSAKVVGLNERKNIGPDQG